MPRKKTDVKGPGWRPKLEINWDVVDGLLQAQCPGSEIAAFIKVGDDTLYERCKREKGMTFSEYSQSKKGVGKAMLRQAQMDLAMNRDRGMLVHLGEHVLGQIKQEKVEHSGDLNLTVKQFKISKPDEPSTDKLDG